MIEHPQATVVLDLQYIKVGIVGGSDEVKICEQLGANGKDPDAREGETCLATSKMVADKL